MVLETRTARTSAVLKMFNDKQGSLMRGKLRQRQSGAQQLTDVGDGQDGQDIVGVLVKQGGVVRVLERPIEAGLGDKPAGKDGQGQVVLPGAELDCLEFVPSELRFGILNGPFDKKALDLR